MKRFTLAIALALAGGTSGTAFAQTENAAMAQLALTNGATVYDPQGGEVGKIESSSADTVVIDTGAHKATLPKSAFGSGAKGPVIGITKAQIDEQVAAAAQKTADAVAAALVVGAEVKGKAGAPIGTIKEVTADQVVIGRAAGSVSLNKRAFTVGSQGLSIPLTAEELDAAAKSAASNAS